MRRLRCTAVVALAVTVVAGACGDKTTGADGAGAPWWTALKVGWTKLSDPPETRAGAAYVWAGSEVLAWGGCAPDVENECVPTADGYAFDPIQDRWRSLPEAPLAAAWADAVWTGAEAVFISIDASESLTGVAFDPSASSWRALKPGPVSSRAGGVQVWTGTEVFVWGGGAPGRPEAANGAAYDPATDSWRRIADAPRGLNAASGMWTGSEVLVFGSLLDHRNIADTDSSVGLAYDPESDTWRELAPSQLSPQATSATWIDERMVAWDYDVDWQEYNPSEDRWSPPQPMPLQFSECYPDSAVAGDQLFAFFCGQAAVYESGSRKWVRVGGGPLEEEIEAHGRRYKLWRFASLVPADDVVFLSMEGITVDADGVPCYGCSGSPVSFWAYRIPSPT
jgi:hypothetical protein